MNNIKNILKNTIWISNPVAYQILGICSSLAVTVQLENGLVMGIALTVVTGGSNFVLSLMREYIPHRIRIIVELIVISVLVIIVDQLLQAFMFEVSKRLSVFVGLIITNCIVMGRAEAFALSNKPFISLIDGIGNGLGYTLILAIIATLRELLGNGTILGIKIIPDFIYNLGYVNNGLMVLPPAAFILLGILIWIIKSLGGAKG